MDFASLPWSSIDGEFIQSLIENKVDESTTIDYKSDLVLIKSDKEKKDYLKDVCSFGNTRGGMILWGVNEVSGIPVEIVGVDDGVVDKAILQMEQLVKTGIEPSIPGVQTKRVEVGDKQCVVQRVPRSLLRPHMITYSQYDKFYTRLSRSNDRMDYRMIRRAFMASENRMDILRRFRDSRITSIASEDLPVSLEFSNLHVIHILPVIAIERDLIPLEIRQKGQNFFPLRSEGPGTATINFDGVVFHDGPYREEESSTYCQVFRSGMIEAVGPISFISQDRIPSIDIEGTTIERVGEYIHGLSELGVSFPFAIGISLIGVKGYKIFQGHREEVGRFHPLKMDILRIPEIIVESGEEPIDSALKVSFDWMWNAGGHLGTPNYDEDGKWVGKK